MRALLCCTFVAVVAVTGVLLAQSAEKEDAMHGSAREKLIGAWHLVSMEEPGADGKVLRITNRNGVLIYTRDGHMSVQIMFRIRLIQRRTVAYAPCAGVDHSETCGQGPCTRVPVF